jgi:hypothetical protein
MMARFYGYIDKVFGFRRLTALLTDSRLEPVIPTAAIFGTAFAMFATGRGSLNGIDLIGQDLAIPLDVELQRPGEGEIPAAKRLLERVFANYRRYFDAVVGTSSACRPLPCS